MVEFAIVVTVLLLLVVGILAFGQYLNYTIDQTHLANLAARLASVNEDPACTNNDPTQCGTTLAQYVEQQADGQLQAGATGGVSAAKVCIVQPTGSSQSLGNPVEATVTSTYSAIPFIHLGTFTVVETATMMLEDTPDSQLYGCYTG